MDSVNDRRYERRWEGDELSKLQRRVTRLEGRTHWLVFWVRVLVITLALLGLLIFWVFLGQTVGQHYPRLST